MSLLYKDGSVQIMTLPDAGWQIEFRVGCDTRGLRLSAQHVASMFQLYRAELTQRAKELRVEAANLEKILGS